MNTKEKNSFILRVSNRGDGVQEIINSTSYAVNVPPDMRARQGTIEFIEGSLVLNVTATDYHYYTSCGVLCNLNQQGYNSESAYGSLQFQPCKNSILFSVDFANIDVSSTHLIPHVSLQPYVMRCGSIPEKIEFSTFAVIEKPVTAGSFVVGKKYKILTLGTTNFVTAGSSESTVGFNFTAITAGVGTGTALLISTVLQSPLSNPYYLSFCLKVTFDDSLK